jgi:hypothetical protein
MRTTERASGCSAPTTVVCCKFYLIVCCLRLTCLRYDQLAACQPNILCGRINDHCFVFGGLLFRGSKSRNHDFLRLPSVSQLDTRIRADFDIGHLCKSYCHRNHGSFYSGEAFWTVNKQHPIPLTAISTTIQAAPCRHSILRLLEQSTETAQCSAFSLIITASPHSHRLKIIASSSGQQT